MRTTITSADLLALLQQMAIDMAAHKDYLCELDGAMGDGDQGITMTLGFGAIAAALPALADQDIGTLLTKSGLGVADLAAMAEAAAAGIQERGKAQRGDKTVLDALLPAATALRAAATAGAGIEAALQAALVAAEAGVQATIPLKARVGRAAWIAERSVGHQDPGATSFALMLKSAVEYLAKLPAK
jgi:dihydroxyacetone kinase-like protein